MYKKEIIFLLVGLISGIVINLGINYATADRDLMRGDLNILVDSTTGEIISAGFTDFSAQVIGGLEQIKGVAAEMPNNITTDYYYDRSRQEIIKRNMPIKSKLQREIDDDREETKQDYLRLKTPEDKADFIARYLGIIDQ